MIFKGAQPGVYPNYSSVVQFTKYFPNPEYKGFSSLEEAMTAARSRLGLNYFVEPETKTAKSFKDFILQTRNSRPTRSEQPAV